MQKLNLPSFGYKLRNDNGKVWIFDVIRKKYLVLTPEEWVRQHFANYLIHHLEYPRSLMKMEGGLEFNRLRKRSDIVVYDSAGEPWMVVECKSPDVPIDDSIMRQASMYNATLRAKFLTITNGMQHFCCRILWDERKTEMLTELPAPEKKTS
jgi:hypothetical protein